MFFVISKLFWFVVQPIDLLVILGVAGAVLAFTPAARFGRGLLVVVAVLFAVISVSPLGSMLVRPLENRFPPPPPDLSAPTDILVLGGALDVDLTQARGSTTLLQAGARLTSAVALARRFPTARLVFTGGSASLSENGLSEADGIRALWLSLGVPESRMVFESKSRNTFENAVFTRDLVQPKPDETWLLVTSAWHMPRAMGIFRQAGFRVTAFPVDYRTFGDARDWKLTHDPLDSLDRVEIAAHEWIGLLAYRLTHKTDALFPAP